MANTIDFTTLALGAVIGMGCRKQLRAAGKVAASAVAAVTTAAAQAAQQVAQETESPKDPQNGQNGKKE